MPQPSDSFTQLASVPVHYDRDSASDYGTRGRPHTFRCATALKNSLERCFNELWQRSSLGRAEVITSAGTFANRPASLHSTGRAFDLDGIFWPARSFVALRYPTDTVFYLGIESVLRKHFGVVLNHNFNSAHHDHFHLDNSNPLGFNPSSRSKVLYLQAALTHMFDIPTAIDGDTGPQTRRNAKALLLRNEWATEAEVDTPDSLHRKINSVWNDILDRAAQIALGPQ